MRAVVLVLHFAICLSTDSLSSSLDQRKELLKRNIVDGTNPMGDSIEEVNMKSGVADTLFQGDIVLTKEQQDQIAADISRARSRRQAFDAKGWEAETWSDGVPYAFAPDSAPTEQVKNAFKKAVKLWMEDTCINFTEYQLPPPRGVKLPMCFLVVYHGDGCVSNVGKVVKAGPQLLSLGDGCGTIGHAAHEIGHTLGFFHTQARYDRDQFITVYKDLMQSGWDDQFTPQTKEANNNYDLTYDYGSVMHYGSRSLSKDKKRPAVVAKDGNYTKTLGSDIIAFYDLLMMNMLYKCTEICKGIPNIDKQCQNGGFPHPRDCSKCICPSGYGGHFCATKPDGCGRVLEAKGDWQEFEDNLDGRGANTERDGYKRCNYWIKAPPGKEIEVKIVKLPENADVDGCKHAGVEIKAHSDPRRTGYRFCSEEDINVTLTSNASIVPVITYNREDRIALTKLAYHYV